MDAGGGGRVGAEHPSPRIRYLEISTTDSRSLFLIHIKIIIINIVESQYNQASIQNSYVFPFLYFSKTRYTLTATFLPANGRTSGLGSTLHMRLSISYSSIVSEAKVIPKMRLEKEL